MLEHKHRWYMSITLILNQYKYSKSQSEWYENGLYNIYKNKEDVEFNSYFLSMTDIPTSMCYYAVVIIYKIELYTKDNTIMNNIVINSKVAKEGEES